MSPTDAADRIVSRADAAHGGAPVAEGMHHPWCPDPLAGSCHAHCDERGRR